jgi:hypothetical protein
MTHDPARRRHRLRRALRQRGAHLSFPGRACPLDGLQRVRHLRLRLDVRALARRPRRSRPQHHLHPVDSALPRDGRLRAPARIDPRIAPGGYCGRGRYRSPRHRRAVALQAARRALHAAGLYRSLLSPALRTHAGAGRSGQGLRLDGGLARAALHPAADAAAACHGGGALCRPADGGDDRSGHGLLSRPGWRV